VRENDAEADEEFQMTMQDWRWSCRTSCMAACLRLYATYVWNRNKTETEL